jgi:hypothetical protein
MFGGITLMIFEIASQTMKISSTLKTCDMSDFEISNYYLMEFRSGSIWSGNLNKGFKFDLD